MTATGQYQARHAEPHWTEEPSVASLDGCGALVTGATGFIGSNLVERPVEIGC